MKEESKEVDVRHYCRICFEEKPDLVSCQNVLVLEDFTCTVEEVLLLLSPQEVRALPMYPTKICPTCKELVEATFALKIMYEKTSEILHKLFTPMGEEIEIKIEPDKCENTDGITGDDFLKILYEHSKTDEPKYEIDNDRYDTEGNIVVVIGNSSTTQHIDQPEYYHIEEDNNCNGENFEMGDPMYEEAENSQPDDDDEFYENLDMKDENVLFEAKKSHIEEEQIILEIEETPFIGLSRNEKRNLYRKRKRYLDKQSTLSLGKRIEEEIEQTVNNSKVELKKSENLSHLCPICFIETTDPFEFKQHIKTHKVLKKYFKGNPLPENCKVVAQPRDIVSIFSRPNDPHWCPYCNESLPALKFGIHLWNHERMDEFYCNKCDRTFYKLRDYNLHKVRSHREEYPFKCNICQQGFVIKYNFDCHMLKHNSREEDLPYACEVCPRKFSNSVHLWRHMHIHNGKGVYGSQYKKYSMNKSKNPHPPTQRVSRQSLYSKTKQKEFRCNMCDKVFRSYLGVYQHLKKVHDKNYMKKMCEVCGKQFASIHSYFKHYKYLHSGTEPHLCDVCGKSFRHYDSFKMHERIHIGNKCHICPVCSKGFLEKAYMKKHLTTHYKNHKAFKYATNLE